MPRKSPYLVLLAALGLNAQITTELRAGHYDRALALAEQDLKARPDDVRTLTLKGIALTKLSRTDEADQAFVAALHNNPDYLPALEGAAELEYKSGSDLAMQHVDHLIALRPSDETAHAMRAVIAWQRHDCATAVQQFELAPHAIEQQPQALRQYAVCLVATNRSEEALHILGSHISADHPDPDLLALASEAYENTGDTPHAVSTLRQAIIEHPTGEHLYVNFASLCFEHKAFQVGVDMVNAGLTQLPRSAKLYMARGVLFAQMGEYQKADADFDTAQSLNPKGTSAAGAKALSQFQAGALDDALATVHTSLTAHPRDAYLHYLLAEILSRKGIQPGTREFSEALDAARAAVQLDPSFNMARDVLSRLYLASGNPQAAIEQSRRALQNDRSDQMAIYRLIRALKAAGKSSDPEISRLTRRLAEVRQAEQAREEKSGRFRLSE